MRPLTSTMPDRPRHRCQERFSPCRWRASLRPSSAWSRPTIVAPISPPRTPVFAACQGRPVPVTDGRSHRLAVYGPIFYTPTNSLLLEPSPAALEEGYHMCTIATSQASPAFRALLTERSTISSSRIRSGENLSLGTPPCAPRLIGQLGI